MNRFIAVFLGVMLVAIAAVTACGFLIDSAFTAVAPAENAGFQIIIDAGHGGEDGGTSAADGTLEKDINLEIAKYLCTMLDAAGYSTVMTRNSDEQIGDLNLPTIRQRKVSDIRKRLSMTEQNPDSILVSIHQNHYSSAKYSGTQVFYSPNSADSPVLAEYIQNSVVAFLQSNNTRGTKKVGTNIYLLYNSQIPSVMVECGFMSNFEEAEKLKTEEYQKQMAFSIMCGIQKYLEEKDG